MWPSASGTSRVLVIAGVATGCLVTLVTLRVSAKVYRLLTHHEEIYSWLSSIIPPTDYDYKLDTPGSRDYVQSKWPGLVDVVDQGTLTVLTRPADFDRALPDELLILGTAHVSKKTAAAVYKCITTAEPDAVVLELCKSRAFMMYRDAPKEEMETSTSEPLDSAPQGTVSEQFRGDSASSARSTATQQPTSNGALQESSASQGLADGEDSRPAGPASVVAQGSQGGDSKPASSLAVAAVPAAAPVEPSLVSQLSGLVHALKTTGNPLQALLGWAYAKVEGQLGTVAGLEFIRARQAIQDLEVKRSNQKRTASSGLLASQQQGREAAPGPGSEAGALPDANSAQPTGTVVRHRVKGLWDELHNRPTDLQLSESAGETPRRRGSHEHEGEAGLSDDAADPGVHIYLGDVPLQRTISRIWGVLSVRQKLRLCWSLLHDCLTLKADDEMLEALLQEDVFQLMQKELGAEFPEAMGPLLHERNWQLSYTVQQAAQHGMKRVVLVVGRGHVPGVIYCLLHPYRLRKAQKADRAAIQRTVSSSAARGVPTAPVAA